MASDVSSFCEKQVGQGGSPQGKGIFFPSPHVMSQHVQLGHLDLFQLFQTHLRQQLMNGMQKWQGATGFPAGAAHSRDTLNGPYGTFATPSSGIGTAAPPEDNVRIVLLSYFCVTEIIMSSSILLALSDMNLFLLYLEMLG